MEEVVRSPLIAWESFYVIVGSSGAALTGLQFVVIALVAEANKQTGRGQESDGQSIAAFGTPTIVHFCAVLFVAAILSAPWPGLSSIGFALGVSGVVGLVYGVIVVRRARRQTGYRPVFEDWLWFAVLPLIAYALLLVSAISLPSHPQLAPFLIAATSLILLFVGIHNAWDSVTYIATERLPASKDPEKPAEAKDQG
jgi:hypothetical protein